MGSPPHPCRQLGRENTTTRAKHGDDEAVALALIVASSSSYSFALAQAIMTRRVRCVVTLARPSHPHAYSHPLAHVNTRVGTTTQCTRSASRCHVYCAVPLARLCCHPHSGTRGYNLQRVQVFNRYRCGYGLRHPCSSLSLHIPVGTSTSLQRHTCRKPVPKWQVLVFGGYGCRYGSQHPWLVLGNRTSVGNTAIIGKWVQRVRVWGGEAVPECTPYSFTAG